MCSIKTCFKCGIEKPLSGFYKHKAMGDGYLNKCKSCTKNDVGTYRKNNIEKVRKYDRDRGVRQTPEYLRSWRAKYPQKRKAHEAVRIAVKSGKIEKASECETCGHDKVVGHHDDYLKMLEVRWLCQACHKQWHRDNGEGKNGSFLK